MPASLQPVFLCLRNALDRLTGQEVALRGGISTPGVVRVGDTVRRPVKEKSAFVHDVLRHLELRGFDRVPRFLGIDEKGRAMLTYISGTVHSQVGGFQKEMACCGKAAKTVPRRNCGLRFERRIRGHLSRGPVPRQLRVSGRNAIRPHRLRWGAARQA